DYTLAAGTLTFTAGQTNKTIAITIVNDIRDEEDETVEVTLSSPTNAVLGTTVHTYTILDNDPPPVLSINNASVTEGNTNMLFSVSMAGSSAKTVTVDYATADVTATASADYAATSCTLTFAPGVTTQQIPVAIHRHSLD